MTEIFDGKNRIGTGHTNEGKFRYASALSELALSDRGVSLFLHFLREGRDARYGENFGKVEGSYTEWLRISGLLPSQLKATVQELCAIGLCEMKDDGIYIKNYDVFVNQGRFEVEKYLSQIKGVK